MGRCSVSQSSWGSLVRICAPPDVMRTVCSNWADLKQHRAVVRTQRTAGAVRPTFPSPNTESNRTESNKHLRLSREMAVQASSRTLNSGDPSVMIGSVRRENIYCRDLIKFLSNIVLADY